MDRRVFLAVILTAVVIVMTPLLFPGTPLPSRGDSTRIGSLAAGSATASIDSTRHDTLRSRASSNVRATARGAQATEDTLRATTPFLVGDSLTVESNHMTVWYSSSGASLLRVALRDYRTRDTAAGPGPVVLAPGHGQPLLHYRLVLDDSSFPLNAAQFSGHVDTSGAERTATYRAQISGRSVEVRYITPAADSSRFLVRVSVQVEGSVGTGTLAIELPPTLASAETDTVDDIRHLAFGYRSVGGDVSSVAFTKLDSGTTRPVAGPLQWVAVRDKYFLVALISPDNSISRAEFRGAPRVAKLAPRAAGEITIPLRNGRAEFSLYAGPQEFERLRALGYGLDQVNPYAGWLHGVVQPFATIVTRVLLWMKRTSGLGYGWVIIIFGVVVRLLLWPLNQSAMRTSIRMQRLQPELAEVQKKYKSDPKKQQEALVKLYQSHGMTPFSPMMGCLPMLIPMPILFALYFVFLNTIEFRGVSFLWMHDISAADPYYITPLVMGLSMFLLSWIGMRGTPPTPQTRMMSYMMPVVLTFMFFRFAAGLNLYYAVQNLAALPQQWLLSKERAGMAASASTGGRRSSG